MYGPAVRCKRFSSSWHSAVLHQCIRPLSECVVLLAIMDISARAVSLTDLNGQLGHQCSHAPGRPILHLFVSSRRPRRVTGKGLGLRHRLSFQCSRRLGGLSDGCGELVVAASTFGFLINGIETEFLRADGQNPSRTSSLADCLRPATPARLCRFPGIEIRCSPCRFIARAATCQLTDINIA